MKATQANLDAARKAHADKPSDATKTALDRATKDAEDAGAVRKQRDATVQAAQKQATEAQKKLDEFLAAKVPELGASVNDFIDRTLRKAWQDPELFNAHNRELRAAMEKTSPSHKHVVESTLQSLLKTGV